VLFNEQFRALYPGLSDVIKQGTRFDDVLKAVIERKLVDLGSMSPEEWMAERRAQHRKPDGFVEYQYWGRHVRISERTIQGGGSVAVYTDITELRQQNIELEQAREASEVANRTKSQFLANMSHELRTPLNAIIGYSEILQEDAAETGQQQFVPDLKKIEGAGRHLLGLINDILDLSKVEAGKMDVFIEEIEVPSLLSEVNAIIAPLAAKNGNKLTIHSSETTGSIRSDRTKLKQCLLNVLSNASKFTRDGKLALNVERFERFMIRMTISDTGIGMNDEQLGRLFQAFSQADASTTKKFGGTGLGLAITRHFCRMLGGDITATSVPGKGSTFTIVIRDQTSGSQTAEPSAADQLASALPAKDSSPTVLVVDDDPASRDLLSTSLKREGYRTVQASGGEEALQLAHRLRPDAITLDVLMPKTDGWAVLASLKGDPELCKVPVIMVTIAPDRAIGLSLGAAEVMTKPVNRSELTTLLRRLLSHDGSILVVEDDLATRDTVRTTIEKMGLAVAEASNGREALTWLSENPVPALILLDLMMPEMDGFEFLDAFNRNPEWRNVPVVVITAKQLTSSERGLLSVWTVIEKGVSIDRDIAAIVGKAIGRPPASGQPDPRSA